MAQITRRPLGKIMQRALSLEADSLRRPSGSPAFFCGGPPPGIIPERAAAGAAGRSASGLIPGGLAALARHRQAEPGDAAPETVPGRTAKQRAAQGRPAGTAYGGVGAGPA